MNKQQFASLFMECKTGEEVKALYKKLALKYHPDRGGDNESMKALNLAFEDAFNRLKNVHRNTKTGETYERTSYEYAGEYIDLINALMKMQGIVVEIVGSFVWVSGETKAVKDDLKALGLKYSGKHKAWYKAPNDYHKKSRNEYTLNDIRGFYGSTVITKTAEEEKQGRLALS